MDKTKINLDAPAFGEGAQNVADLDKEVEKTDETAVEPAKEEVKEEKPEGKSDDEPERVKYSRFKNVLDRAKEAEEEAAHWRQIAQGFKPKEEESVELPAHWVKLYGDSPEAKEAWLIQKEQNEEVKREAREEALKALREERTQEATRTKENISEIDSRIDELSDSIGRELTDKEQSSLLDIVDEYSPKDGDGNYIAMIPFDKAWEIYEVKSQVSKSPKTKSRDAVASLNGSRSEGESTITEKDKTFNPLDWNAWRNRI